MRQEQSSIKTEKERKKTQHRKKRELQRKAAQYKVQLGLVEALETKKQARARVAAKAEAEDMARDLLEVQDKLCELCFENEKCVEFHPCGHRTCHQCALGWRQQTLTKTQQATTCPYCREVITKLLRL
jgi:hypothetical protein